MKRPNRSDTLTVVDQETPICLSVNNDDEEKLVYKKRLGCFQTLLDNLGEEDDIFCDGDGGCGGLGEKKRRLRLDQVKALEKIFEVENKLEPERKAKLAEELGLQPRQVAVWFQNRRARWKTKQLERDYGILKAEYESLELDHEALRCNNEALLTQIKELKTKIEDGSSVKDATLQLVKNEELMKTRQEEVVDVKESDVEREEEEKGERSLPALKYKDGSSDSDASVILNDDGSGGINSSSPSGAMSNLRHHPQQQMCFIGNDDCSSSSPFQFLGESSRGSRGDNYQYYFQYHQQKEEEERMLAVEQHIGHDFLNDGGSSIFSDEQVQALPWYHCSDQWT